MAAPAHGHQMRAFGRLLRAIGQSLDRTGLGIMGTEGYVERREWRGASSGARRGGLRHHWRRAPAAFAAGLSPPSCATVPALSSPPRLPASPHALPAPAVVPSTRVVPIKGKQFTYGLQNFVASSASVVGEVKMGEMSSVWYGATLRGA
jgi:hypothetical protein